MPEPVNEWTVADGITLHLLQDEYPAGVSVMTLVLENRSDLAMSYGGGWNYEKWIDGKWQPLANKENMGWTAEAYYLFDHSKATFKVSTAALKEKLTPGLYRVTSCFSLFTAKDDYNLHRGGEGFVEHPPYQLEFLVSSNAASEAKVKDNWLDKRNLPEIEDWEWYAPTVPITMYTNFSKTVWGGKQLSDGIMVLCWKERSVNESLSMDDRFKLDVFDRKTGEFFNVIKDPVVLPEGDITETDNGFSVTTETGRAEICFENGDWVVK